MNRQQARRQFVLLENSDVYRLGQRRRIDWLVFTVWGLIGVWVGAMLAGLAFVAVLGVSAVVRWWGG